jgi:hypothetical protein
LRIQHGMRVVDWEACGFEKKKKAVIPWRKKRECIVHCQLQLSVSCSLALTYPSSIMV